MVCLRTADGGIYALAPGDYIKIAPAKSQKINGDTEVLWHVAMSRSVGPTRLYLSHAYTEYNAARAALDLLAEEIEHLAGSASGMVFVDLARLWGHRG